MGETFIKAGWFAGLCATRQAADQGHLTDISRSTTVRAEGVFRSMLTLERRRAERSRKPFVLMLLAAPEENGSAPSVLAEALVAVGARCRETDLVGWYQTGVVAGVIFTELGSDATEALAATLECKAQSALRDGLGPERAARIVISLHTFPQSGDRGRRDWTADSQLYPDLQADRPGEKARLALKRAIDIAGSALILLVTSPVLLAIAAAIKLTSKGPVLFEQERLGKLGARFKMLKFRTMYVDSDPRIHEEYVRQFIAGNAKAHSHDSSAPVVYKITNDPRVTTIGRFLRKTSLDEFPQFWNVLRGEMSLVGPRPPLPYEFEAYDIWHRRRVFELKPGVTGLWQVSGRSRMQFDDMVRLDLRYRQSWTLWLDLKILLATPRAVLSGEGAY